MELVGVDSNYGTCKSPDSTFSKLLYTLDEMTGLSRRTVHFVHPLDFPHELTSLAF